MPSIIRVRMPDGRILEIPALQGPPGPAGDGSGDMLASTYDPNGRKQDIFKYVDDKVAGVGDIVCAVVDTTTYAAIKAAVAAGKPVLCYDQGGDYPRLAVLSEQTESAFVFKAPAASSIAVYTCTLEEDATAWTSSTEEYTPAAHAEKHKTGGGDELKPEDIGAAAATHAAQHKTGGADALTPADIGAATPPKCVTVTLTAAGWSDGLQTAAVAGVLEAEGKQLIQPVPAIASQSAYLAAGIRCVSQAADSLTFTADSVPEADLTVYIVIQEVAA